MSRSSTVLMGWQNDFKPPPPKPGAWERWSYGHDVEGWSLRCGPMFFADVRKVGAAGEYYATLNSDILGNDPDPQKLMRAVDREIVRRVRELIPAYKVLRARTVKATVES
jgi:hypothetical protein